jgi:hypothetical protein
MAALRHAGDISLLSAATLAVWGLLYGPAERDVLESVW